MFESPKSDQFTQGTIFSCAFAENYSDVPAYGLVITARCDAAQKKVPIYSFIPVVSIRDWIFRDGAEIALRRRNQDLQNTLENLLEGLELSPSVLRTTPVTEVIERLLKPLAVADRRASTKVQKFIDATNAVAEIESSLQVGTRVALSPVLSKASRTVDQVVKELAGNKLVGYYLLRSMPVLYDDNPVDHVALLREVHHIPNGLALRITRGVSNIDWNDNPILGTCCPLFSESHDYCMPVAKLRSPWVEHLMQSWTMLFARIGVEDVDFKAVKKSLEGLGLEAP